MKDDSAGWWELGLDGQWLNSLGERGTYEFTPGEGDEVNGELAFYDATGAVVYTGNVQGAGLGIKGDTEVLWNLEKNPNTVNFEAVYAYAAELGFEGDLEELVKLFKGDSAYGLAKKYGYTGTEKDWLDSLRGEKGDSGKSAYDLVVELGYKGTLSDWLSSLMGDKGDKGDKGDQGDSAYDIACGFGFIGTIQDWLNSLGGNGIEKIEKTSSEGNVDTYTIFYTKGGTTTFTVTNGKSAYELAVENGYQGTLEEWLASLVGETGAQGADGKSAYELAVENGYEGTLDDWLESLVGATGATGEAGSDGKSAYELAVENGFGGSLEEWLTSLVGSSGEDGTDGADGEDGAPGADGVGIDRIEKTGSDGNVDTYTIYFTNGETTTFTVTNAPVEEIVTVTVTFDANGGIISGYTYIELNATEVSGVYTVELESGESIEQLPEPTKTGYRFSGWYTGDSVNDSRWFNNLSIVSDMTLYAGWTEIGHSLVHYDRVEPDCTNDGNIEYWYCPYCDQYFLDAAGANSIRENQIGIPATGHSYVISEVTEPTCTVAGETVYVCERCDDSYIVTVLASHNYEPVKTVAATCTEAGYQLFRCSVCEDEYTIEIPAGGGHDYVGVVTKQPTTEEEGVMTYTCSVCSDSYTMPLAKLNEGSGKVLLVQDRLPWTTDNNAVILNYLTANQMIDGWEIVSSSGLSSAVLGEYNVIYIANDQTTATYNRLQQLSGALTEYVEGGGVLIYGACDHGWAAGDISYDLPGGVSIGNYYSNYNYIVNGSHDIVTGILTGGEKLTDEMLYSTYSSHTTFHNLPEGSTVILQDAHGDPTLAEYPLGAGYVIASGLTWEYTYERTFVDGSSFAKEIFDDLFVYAMSLSSKCDHVYEQTAVVRPTCTTDGYTEYTCTECGRKFRSAFVSATGHDWNTGEVTTAATCTDDGVKTYTCGNCGETRTETIAATGHSFTNYVSDGNATCTSDGTETAICDNCDATDTRTDVGSATGHNFVDGVCSACGEKFYSEGLEYTLSGDKTYYIVTGIGTASGDIIIPDTHEGLPVTYIGSYAFRDCSSLTSISIPAGVAELPDGSWNGTTYIGVFSGCSNLTGVSFAEGSQLTSIGSYAFYGCSNLTSIEIPAGVTSIGYAAFSGCTNLESVTFAEGSELTSIGGSAFDGCSSLTSISIPAGVTSIGSNAFSRCSNLVSVTFAEGSQLTSIGDWAFDGCSNLNKVYYAGSIEDWFNIEFGRYDSNPLNNGTDLYIDGELVTEVVVPESVTTIGDQLSGCISLTSITIHSGVTSIGSNAFDHCSSLTSIEIPAGVTSIGDDAFDGCSSLASVTFAEGSQLTSIGDNAFDGCSSLQSIEIPAGVTSIGSWAFDGCSSLKSIEIPAGVTSIGFGAFYGCSSLTSIEIPAGVTSIGEYAFYGCSSLTSIEIPAGVTSIAGSAFRDCSTLTSVAIPAGVTSIGSHAFYGCSNLESITFAEGSQLTSIGSSAFQVCSNLETIYYNGTEEQWNAIGKGSHWDSNCGNYEVVFLGDAGAEA